MKETIRVFSDIHLEYYPSCDQVDIIFENLFSDWQEPVDKLIFAGDICSVSPGHLPKLIAWFYNVFKNKLAKEVYYVWGNHEFYGSDWEDESRFSIVRNQLQELAADYEQQFFTCHKEFNWLIDKSVFLSTLWYPDKPDVWLLQDELSDFKCIQNCSPSRFIGEFGMTKAMLELLTPEDRPDIWVFHHLPSHFSITPQYKNDRLNCYFVGDITEEIVRLQPKMVIHGHSHTPVDYFIGNTLVKSNPILN